MINKVYRTVFAIEIPIPNFCPLELPWRFDEQKFGIGISMDRSLGPIYHIIWVFKISLSKYLVQVGI